MKKLVFSIIACAALGISAKAQPASGNPFGTVGGSGSGSGGSATNVVSSTNTGLLYISPLPLGNNGATDFRTNQPNFVGQIGVGMDTANAGSGIYLFGAKSNTVGGWDGQFNFPAGIASVGSKWNTPTNSNNRIVSWHLNGNAKWATRSNIVLASGASVDSGWYFSQINPYGCALLWTPITTTNADYRWTASGPIGTNVLGEVIYYDEDPFGLTFGSIPRHWPALETNQAGSYVILLGGGGSTKPFHIADNHTEGTQLGQFSYLTIDRRGLTNVTSPWGIGFPLRVTNAWSETNVNFRWSLFSDYKTGALFVTNALTTLHSIYADNTANGANRFGKWSEAVAPNNFSGGASFNSHLKDAAGYYAAWTFDAAAGHRLGYMIQSGSYPVQAFAKGSDFRLVQSSATDLQSSISGQTFTNMLTITNNVLAVHTPGFRVDGNQTNNGNLFMGTSAYISAGVFWANSAGGYFTFNNDTYLNRRGIGNVVLSQTGGGSATANASLTASNVFLSGAAYTTNGLVLPPSSGPTGITNGLSAFWNSNGVATYIRSGPTGYTTNKDTVIVVH